MLDDVSWTLFDAVGTLLHPRTPVAEVYAAVGRRYGSRMSLEEVGIRFAATLKVEQVCDRLQRAATNDALERERWQRIVGAVIDDVDDGQGVFEELWRHFGQPESWLVFEDVAEALERLSGRGIRLGIASNFDGRLRDVVAGRRELSRCEALFVSSEVGYSKPDPRFFAEVHKQLGAMPAEIALVGDDWVNDVEGARAAGWKALHLDRCGRVFGDRRSIKSLRELD